VRKGKERKEKKTSLFVSACGGGQTERWPHHWRRGRARWRRTSRRWKRTSVTWLQERIKTLESDKEDLKKKVEDLKERLEKTFKEEIGREVISYAEKLKKNTC
jgi:uncharacterized protein YlxW (UPF0749 family)